jgi:hypothetical protein
MKLWDAETGQRIREVQDGWGDFTADGKRIFGVSVEGNAQFWDAETGLPVRDSQRVVENGLFDDATLSPDGRHIVEVSNGSAQLTTMPVDMRALISHAKAAIPRCLTRKQREAYFLSLSRTAPVVHRDD